MVEEEICMFIIANKVYTRELHLKPASFQSVSL